MPLPILVSLYLVAGILTVGGYLLYRMLKHKKLVEQLKLKLLLVRLPKTNSAQEKNQTGDRPKDEKEEILLAEQLVSGLAAFKKPFILEAAVPHVGEEIHLYVAVLDHLVDSAIRQIQSLWPAADVHESEDFNIFNHVGKVAAVFVNQKENPALPFRTYQEMNVDTFSPILGALSKVNEVGEGAVIQVIAKPAKKSSKKSIRKMLEHLKKGNSLKSLLTTKMEGFAPGEIWEVLTEKKKTGDDALKVQNQKIIDESAVKALEMKLGKPLFQVNIRLLASAPSDYQAQSLLNSLVAGFSQFGAPERNDVKMVRPRNMKEFVYKYSFREYSDSEGMLLNSEELVSMFHFPTKGNMIPRIKYLKSKESAPPSELVTSGVLLGRSMYRGEIKNVHVADDDRRRHIYVIGSTGTGKTNLITNMATDDIRRGKGVGIIDPHGELVDTVLSLIPKERQEDVVVFDPSDTARPLGLNMLEYDDSRPEEKTFIVNEMQGIFNKLFAQETMGPMFEQYMRNALLLLMEDSATEPATLMEVSRVFTDDDYREAKLERIKNPAVIDFWEKEAVRAGGEAALSNMTPYITSKFNNFTANDYVRPIIGQTKSAFNVRDIMDKNKILLINLSKGKIGDINANLLGMIIVGKLLMAALSRVDIPQEERKDFNLFIDEFQNFTTDSISVILAEARKYRLNLTIAHQFIAQLNEKIRDAVFGNVGSIVSFRVGPQDTEILNKAFTPEFSDHDLMNIDNGNAYVKLLMRGAPTKPFNINIPLAEKGNEDSVKDLKELSRLKYGRPRQEVEDEIYKRLRE